MLDALADPEHPGHGEVAEYLDGWDPKEIDELPSRFPSAASPIAAVLLGQKSPRKRADPAGWPSVSLNLLARV